MATRINLIDWRTARRERNKQQFYALLGLAFAVSAAVVLGGYAVMSARIAHQQQRNDFLRAQIAELDKQIKEIQDLEKVKQNLLARMRVIEQLQASRSATVHFFDEVVNTVPEGVYLTAIKQNGASVTIDGVAESNGRVSTYMKSLDASHWFADPRLIVIKTGERNRLRESQFQLQVRRLTQPAAGDQTAAEGQP